MTVQKAGLYCNPLTHNDENDEKAKAEAAEEQEKAFQQELKADQKQWDKDYFEPSMNIHQRREALDRDMQKILNDKAQIKKAQLDKEQALYYYHCELARPGADQQKNH